MPDPVRWHLRFPAASEDDLHQLRLYHEAFIRDAHVLHVQGITVFSEDVRDLVITFREGWTQPENPTLHYMDRRFPLHERPATAQVQINDPPFWNGVPLVSRENAQRVLEGLRVDPSGMMIPQSGFFDFETLPAAPPSIDPVELPAWLKMGVWVRHRRNQHQVFKIKGLRTPPNGVLSVTALGFNPQEFRGHSMSITIPLNTFILDYEPTQEPRDTRPTAWQRLLDGLDEEPHVEAPAPHPWLKK